MNIFETPTTNKFPLNLSMQSKGLQLKYRLISTLYTGLSRNLEGLSDPKKVPKLQNLDKSNDIQKVGVQAMVSANIAVD